MFATKVCAMRGAIHIWKQNHVHVLERARAQSITELIHTSAWPVSFCPWPWSLWKLWNPLVMMPTDPTARISATILRITTATSNTRLGTVVTNRFTHRQWRKMAHWTLNQAQREEYCMFTMYDLSKTRRKRVNMSLDNGMVLGKLFRVLMS